MDAGGIFGLVPRILWEPVAGPPDEQNRLPMGLNCILIRSHGRNILIDTGVGNKESARRQLVKPDPNGRLLDDLAASGVRPEEIDVVINTHLHFDHCGWNTVKQDNKVVPTFPRARYLVERGEWEAATHPNERTRGTYHAENFQPLAETGQLELIEGEVAVTPEVTVMPVSGHTDDHVCVLITSGGEKGLYIGELAQYPVMLERLAWISAFDILPLVTLENKRRLVEQAAREGWHIIGVHLPYPGIGKLVEEGSRRKWVPAQL